MNLLQMRFLIRQINLLGPMKMELADRIHTEINIQAYLWMTCYV